MAVINTLEVKITGDSSDLQKKLRQSATDVAKWGAAATGAAVAATAALTSMGLKSVDSLAKMSRAVDGSINSLQALKMAAGDTGLEGLESSLARMNRRLGAAEFGAGAAAVTVEALGLNLEELSAMDVDQRLQSIAQSMRDAGLSSEQTARHLQNLGFEQSQAVEFFNKGINSLEGYKNEIDALGLSLTNIDAAKVEAANDAMGIFGDAIDAVSQQLAVRFSPLITAVSEQFQDAAMEAGGFGDATMRAYDMAINGAGFAINAVDGVGRAFSLTADSLVTGFAHIVKRFSADYAALFTILNEVPGMDFSDTIASLENYYADANKVIEFAGKNMSQTIQRPMAGEAFKKFVKQSEEAAEAAAQAQIEAREKADAASGSSLVALTEKERQKLDERIDNIVQNQMTEEQLAGQHRSKQMEDLVEAYEQELITRQEYNELIAGVEKEHQDTITDIEEEAAKARKKIADEEAKTKEAVYDGMFKNLSSLMNTESKKLFNIGKVSAIANAAVEGYEAAISSYKHGAKIGGPILGAAFAATSIAATGNLINNIKSQSFGGGGGGGAPVAATQGASNVTAPAPSAGTLTVQGLSSDALFTGDAVGQIAEELLDYQRRGGQVLLA